MRATAIAIAALAALFVAAGCGSGQQTKPTQDAVTEFKGNPTAPSLQEKLRAGVGGGSSSPAPAASGSQ